MDATWAANQLNEFARMIGWLSELKMTSHSDTEEERDDLDREVRRQEPIMRLAENAIRPGSGNYSPEYDEWRERWWNARNAALQAAGDEAVPYAFSTNEVKPGEPRLRFAGDRTSDTWKSRQVGAENFGVGCFSGIRNPAAHESDLVLDEPVVLEQLAALSLLAWWIDECVVEHVA